MFKVNSKDSITTSELFAKIVNGILVSLLLTWNLFTPFCNVSIVDFKQVIVCWYVNF